MRRYVPFLLSLKYLRARQFRIGINLVLSSAADAIISSSRLCTRHFSETPISLRYPSIPFHFFFSTSLFSFYFFILPAFPILYRLDWLRSFPRKSMTRRILSTIVFIVDRCRSTSKLHCSTRQQIDSETRRRAVVIVTREQSISVYFF